MITQYLPEFVKYGKIPALSWPEEISRFDLNGFKIFEKLDGGLCQVRKTHDNKLLPGSKANYLTGKKVRSREWFENFVGWTHSNSSLYNLPDNAVVFGEWLGNHTLKYNPENENKFYLIDVLDLDSGQFFDYSDSVELIRDWGIEDVMFLEEFSNGRLTKEGLERVLFDKSSYRNDRKEGVIIKNYSVSPQVFHKVYHPASSEKVIFADGSVDLLTAVRFNKSIFRLLEHGKSGRLNGEGLVKEVIKDIKEEEKMCLDYDTVFNRLIEHINQGHLGKVDIDLS